MIAADASAAEVSSDAPAQLRPQHELAKAWWPVILTHGLDRSRPHPVQLLGQSLVVWHDGAAWRCFADACAHRFAPLSEGRVEGGCLQCSYHGWSFDGGGGCARVPQAQQPHAAGERARVGAFQTREEAGMLWVWGDAASTAAEAEAALPLPLSPLLRQLCERSPAAGFQRDLPYGYELLGENLLDVSHLPFSHHGVGGLAREAGGSLELRPLPPSPPAPGAARFSAAVLQPARDDPVLKGMAAAFPSMVDSAAASVNISFFAPQHVRYERRPRPGAAANVELFLCPTAQGRSRVFLFNAFAAGARPAVPSRMARLLLSKAVGAVRRLLVGGPPPRSFGAPGTVADHMLSHLIFDGDGIFLHYQGQRMAERGLSFRDYFTPTSADALVLRFRTWLSSARRGSDPAVAAAAGSEAGETGEAGERGGYGRSLERAQLLDRYDSHTRHCAVCSAELDRVRAAAKLCKRLGEACIALAGGVLAAALGGAASPRVAGSALAGGALALWRLERAQAQLHREAAAFIFVDYVHADRD